MLTTKRLILRRWKESDLEPFAQLNADPIVMQHFQNPATFQETKEMIERIETRFEEEPIPFGLWATELAETGQFIGFIGLMRPRFEAHFTPCIEIGWRLAREFWGHGYAPEGAKIVLKYGFESVGADEIVAITATPNTNSIRVMQKIGMYTNPSENFEHPYVPEGHHLREHVLYRLSKNVWRDRGQAPNAVH